MDTPPPLLNFQQKKDADHLRLLAAFHFVLAGLALIGIGFIVLHHGLMQHFFDNPEMWKNQKGGPPPAEFFSIFKWFYLFMGTAFLAGGIVNLVSGLFIQKRKYRLFSLIVAGINCIQIPFGTTLGIFTIIVLLRESVRDLYPGNEK